MTYAANVIDGNDQNSMTHAAYAIELKKLISKSFLYKAFFKYLEVQEMLVIVCAQQSNYVIKLYTHDGKTRNYNKLFFHYLYKFVFFII